MNSAAEVTVGFECFLVDNFRIKEYFEPAFSFSARLWGYCASVMLANTLDEDLRSWKTVLELPLIDLQSISHFVASSSEYSSNKFFAIVRSFHVLAS